MKGGPRGRKRDRAHATRRRLGKRGVTAHTLSTSRHFLQCGPHPSCCLQGLSYRLYLPRCLAAALCRYLVMKRPWPALARTLAGDHKRYTQTYFGQYRGYYFTGDGARRDEDGCATSACSWCCLHAVRHCRHCMDAFKCVLPKRFHWSLATLSCMCVLAELHAFLDIPAPSALCHKPLRQLLLDLWARG